MTADGDGRFRPSPSSSRPHRSPHPRSVPARRHQPAALLLPALHRGPNRACSAATQVQVGRRTYSDVRVLGMHVSHRLAFESPWTRRRCCRAASVSSGGA